LNRSKGTLRRQAARIELIAAPDTAVIVLRLLVLRAPPIIAVSYLFGFLTNIQLYARSTIQSRHNIQPRGNLLGV